MIDERANLNLVSQLGHSADMVVVVVSDHDELDLTDARDLCSGGNAVGISALKTWPTGINQQGLPGRADDKRCLPTLHIDEVDVQWLLSFSKAEQRKE